MMSLSLVLGLMRILMLSGDIELNPGPGNPPQLRDLFRLLRLHSGDWENIGRALDVNKKFRDELFGLGIMRSNDSKLEDVLEKWIESQCSEVSWDHLIEVLEEEQMVDTISKIKDYLLNNAKGKEKYQWKEDHNTEDDINVTEILSSVSNTMENECVVYNDDCGWMSCKCSYIVLLTTEKMCRRKFKSNNSSTTNLELLDTTKLPTRLDLHCARKSDSSSVIDCHCYHSIRYRMAYDHLNLIFKSKEPKQCRELAKTVFNNDFCVSHLFGYTAHPQNEIHMRAILYFLQHSDTTWNIVHLYPSEDSITDLNDDSLHSIHTKTLKVYCNYVPPSIQSSTVLGCIDLISHDCLECFECYLDNSYSETNLLADEILVQLFKLPCLRKVSLVMCPFKLKAKDILIDALSNNTTVRELQLLMPKSYANYYRKFDWRETGIAASAIMEGITRNNTITSLVMEGFDFSEAHGEIKELLRNNKRLQKLVFKLVIDAIPVNKLHLLEITQQPINTPLQVVDVSSLGGLTECIVCNLTNSYLQSLTIYFNNANLESLSRIATSLGTSHPNLTELHLVMPECTPCLLDKAEARKNAGMLNEILKSVESLQVLVVKGTPTLDLLEAIHDNLKSLRHLEFVGPYYDIPPLTLVSLSFTLSTIITLNSDIKVLKVPVHCTNNIKKFINKDIAKLKNLKTLELTVIMMKTDSYQVVVGVFSVVNIILGSCHTLKQLTLKVQNLKNIGNSFDEEDIKNHPLLKEFTELVISHPCLEYIMIDFHNISCHYAMLKSNFDEDNWIYKLRNDIFVGCHPERKTPPIVDFICHHH